MTEEVAAVAQNNDPFGLKTATVETPPASPPEAGKEPDGETGEGEQETPAGGEEGGEELAAALEGEAEEKRPRGKRAIEEFEKRIRAEERTKNLEEKLAEKEELLKQRDDSFGEIFKSKEKEAEKDAPLTDDDYLTANGFDPDDFLSDAQKESTLKMLRRQDALEKKFTETEEETKKRLAMEAESSSERAAITELSGEISQLAEAEQAIAWDAVNYLHNVVAQTKIINFEATKAGLDAIKEYGMKKVHAAAIAEAEKEIRNALKSIVKEGGSPLKWAAQSAKVAGFDFNGSSKKERATGIDLNALGKAQERSGRAAIDRAGGGMVASVKESEKLKLEGWR